MELVCPSCGVKHQSEDYPQAFEIHCSCGYSLLVPEISSVKDFVPIPDAAFADSRPTSMDEDDIKVEASIPLPAKSSDLQASSGTLQMTPPEQLPEGMVYDPYELPGSELASLSSNSSAGFEGLIEGQIESDVIVLATELEKSSQKKVPVKAQAIVERSQLASMGQYLGPSYSLRCEGLDTEALSQLLLRCRQQMAQRPWLETEIRRRGLNLQDLVDTGNLADVPEILAVEVFLGAFEMGGRCEFERT